MDWPAMRLVPVLFPCDLGSSQRGEYRPMGERGAPDLILDMFEGEGVRFARPCLVPVEPPASAASLEAPLKFDEAITTAVTALAEAVSEVNSQGNFPLIFGGDQLAMCGQVLGAGPQEEGVGLAVLADAHLDLATPASPAFDDGDALKDAERTWDGDADRMVLSACLGLLPETTSFGALMKKTAARAKQTSVFGVRGPENAQVKANERRSGIDVWRMERLELDGESAYRTVLSRQLEMGPIVLSIDASGLDPHLMTAVRRSVPDGVDWSFLKRSLEQCAPHTDRLLGLDICGIDPTLDDVHHSAVQRLVETIAPFLRRLIR